MTARSGVHIYFSGQVQGVGFRYTTQRLAGRFGVSGWVKNLADGRVELLAYGQPVTIETFLSQLRAAMGRYIRGERCEPVAAPAEIDDSFHIVY